MQAVFTLDRKILETTVTKATLCGIDTLGTIHLDDGTVNLNVDFSAENQDFTSSYGCLSANEIEMSGSYDLSGQFTASAPSFEQLFASAGGQFEFIARDGVITRSKRLSRILEVINFTEIVKGRLPDLKSKGFSYDTIIIEGSLENHLVSFNQIMMDGKTLDLLGKGTLRLDRDRLDVELVAAPFQTVDSAIKNIPGVNYLMAGTLVSIPVRIKGKSADPKVSVMSAADISSNFLDFVERAVKSPVKLIQNWNPYNKSTAPE
ncbi:MAG: AsmA-like C-terminal domain-containing protein [Desulfobacterales bacterium]